MFAREWTGSLRAVLGGEGVGGVEAAGAEILEVPHLGFRGVQHLPSHDVGDLAQQVRDLGLGHSQPIARSMKPITNMAT